MNSKYGNPVGAPDFKPLNAHGHMPKRQPKPDTSMWCVSVMDITAMPHQRKLVGLVGPRDGAELLAGEIRKQIELKGKRVWAQDPQVVRVFS